ncbi:RHS repeat-associated core domain-containing protein [Pseudomonas sp. S37]|uniref:RHS repeat-associated core domain-containing protein n=1 Tax=Pseudomonas sp. S37 TaxID=2767449 RepID=UPI003FA6EBE0
MRTQNCPIAELSAGNASLLGTDRQGSVLFLDTGDHTRAFNYSAFGYDAVGNEKESMLGFCQQPREPLTGFYLLGQGYRAYHSGLQRFSSPDRYSPFEEGGINPYAYCNDDPINLTDPTGEAGGPLYAFKETILPVVLDVPQRPQPRRNEPNPVAIPVALDNRQPVQPPPPAPLPRSNPPPVINNASNAPVERPAGQSPILGQPSNASPNQGARPVQPFFGWFRQNSVPRNSSDRPRRQQSAANMHALLRESRQPQNRPTQWPPNRGQEIRR